MGTAAQSRSRCLVVGTLRRDPAAADHVQLDPAAREPAHVVEGASKVPGEAVEVVDDDDLRELPARAAQ